MKGFAHLASRPTPGILADAALRPSRPPDTDRRDDSRSGRDVGRARRGAASYRAGLAAEDGVARLYQLAGAAILARRWRVPEGEIDLIVRDGDALVFVEVKRRRRPLSEDPVKPRQWRRLEAAALRYMMLAETGDAPLRFDLAIVGEDGTAEVIKNARQ